MPIALDTNVLWPVLTEAQPAVSVLAPIIESYNTSDGLVVCGAVYAELLAGPGATASIVDASLARVGIVIDDALPLAIWREAGLAYRAYAERRLASEGALPRRILADFIIGAHALHTASALMTLNRSDFARLFPALPLIVPSLNPQSPDAATHED
jgi:predicted nucleic acid-binding protein